MHDNMALTSLIVCADAEAVQVLSGIFQDLGIRVETCGSAAAAQTRMRERRFDVVVFDCHVEHSATALISQARSSSFHRASVIIALVGAKNRSLPIFEEGADFLLYKPISRERALHSLHAARGLIRSERRAQPRIPLHVPASIAYDGKEDVTATVLEISETGLGFSSLDDSPPSGKVYFQFPLPGEESVLRLAGEVIWRAATGRVGVRFVNLPQASKRLLKRWLEAQSEVERPSSTTAAASETSVRVSTGLGLLSASASDRRNLSRRACCLGAEVYRADSNIPNRCSLTDISSGGCYVETTEPFPAGTVVTIVVRTLDFKLCVAGNVQSVHPAFGMGIKFNLATEEEHAQVQQLIARAGNQSRLTR
jgi:CheY-like chemotaxis protein